MKKTWVLSQRAQGFKHSNTQVFISVIWKKCSIYFLPKRRGGCLYSRGCLNSYKYGIVHTKVLHPISWLCWEFWMTCTNCIIIFISVVYILNNGFVRKDHNLTIISFNSLCKAEKNRMLFFMYSAMGCIIYLYMLKLFTIIAILSVNQWSWWKHHYTDGLYVRNPR